MSRISKRRFCLENNLEIQYFDVLVSSGIIEVIIKDNGRYLVDTNEAKKLKKGINYVECPFCKKKMSSVTDKHYKVCAQADNTKVNLYSALNLKNREKTEKQKKAQSIRLKKRFKTPEGQITRDQIANASKKTNNDPDFLKRKSEISKIVQNRPENKKLRSQSSKKMWEDPEFREKTKKRVKESIDELRMSAKRARSYINKTSKLHIAYKKSMTFLGLEGFISEYEVGPYSIDEADPLAKIAIEIDGCYWHGCDKCKYPGDPRIKRIDSRKEGYLSKYGWHLIRIKEHEIKSNPNICIEMIRTVQKKRTDYNIKRIKESFFNGHLKVKSMSEDKEGVEWKDLRDVYRHITPHKRMLRVETDRGSVVVTEDHSLFSWDTKDPVEASDLKKGYMIVANENNELVCAEVTDIIEVDKENHTYDLCVPGTESAFLSSGILVHNSYSISGVSLDVDKSAKYEGMKNNFIQEYDKLKEQAKRSIKIIRGLRQPRYGVGISSALGPYSSPGVQARRNFISGFRN